MNWFTADPHFGHQALLNFNLERTVHFSHIDAWDRYVLKMINDYVVKGDRLFILGDFTCGADPAKYRNQIKKGQIYLIRGNHDKSDQRCKQVFGKMNVRDTFIAKCCNIPIFLSHYAHAYWPGSHKNHFHAYGHTHAQRESTLNFIWPERRSLDVGLDNAMRVLGEFRPFSEDDIFTLLGNKKGHDDVDFYKNFNKAIERYESA